MAQIRRRILKLGVVDFGIENATLPNGLELELPVIRHPGASAIVALDAEMKVAMLSQYRHAIDGWMWEVAAGCRTAGESALDCAKRELGEEAGLAAAQWDHIGAVITVPSFCDERIELFLARELSVGAGLLDRDEVIRVERVQLEETFAMIRRGEIVDAKTIAALYRARDFLEREGGGERS
jgi:ADP-ribose diphosphatase